MRTGPDQGFNVAASLRTRNPRQSPGGGSSSDTLQCGRVAEDAESRTSQSAADRLVGLQCGRVAEDAESRGTGRGTWTALPCFNVAASLRTRNPGSAAAIHKHHAIASMWPRR